MTHLYWVPAEDVWSFGVAEWLKVLGTEVCTASARVQIAAMGAVICRLAWAGVIAQMAHSIF